jgi:CRISPR-associated endoribonuclease Cas6
MRFRITFNRTTKQRMLPMDYQYYISAWIYKVLKLADRDFARFLHEEGYGADAPKQYKLFCFSQLNFGKPKLWKEHKLFEIAANKLSLDVAFDVSVAATNFIKGLFLAQEFFLGNKFNGIDLKVIGVEALAEPQYATTMHYSLKSPWVVSFKTPESKNAQYLRPEDPYFNELSVKHIAEKYQNTRNETISEDQITFTPDEKYKRAGFLIKPGTPQQTRVVGNLFDFSLTAPINIHKMIWSAGVSEKSSSGFGWIEINQN